MKKFQILAVNLDCNWEVFAIAKNLETGAKLTLRGLSIDCSKQREVICIEGEYGLNAGQTYHLRTMEIGSWKTSVYLDEFPNVGFNSVLFAEMPQGC